MEIPKFSKDSLVISDSKIYEVINSIPSKNGYSYILKLQAFLRDPSPSEWNNQLKSTEKIILENKLSSFNNPKPKYELGSRVKLPYFNCHVKFIKFENYHYQYHVKDELGDGGWIVEEGYLST